MAVLKAKDENAQLNIFNHPIFMSNLFQQYQQSVIGQLDTCTPEDRAFAQSDPLLAEIVKSQMLIVNDKIDMVNNRVNALHGKVDQYHQQITRDMMGHFTKLKNTPLYFADASTPAPSSSSSNAGPSSTSSNTAQCPVPTSSVPTYTLNRDLCTVNQVWQEYEVGRPGCPSVKQLEEDYGTKWRRDPTQSRYYLRRKVLYDELERIAGEKRISLEDAAGVLEETRKRNSKSLDTLSTMISTQNKNRKLN